ncbi:MAG: response regulator [Eubacteriales bacterium]|nr:response regulator [Eubacteriales bacterium]
MNLIIVDDQKTVLSSLRNGVAWEKLPIEEIYLASSAGEAKELLRNHRIDLMLTDIEMPGEDGLSLFAWVKEYDPKIECIFLTAHADFQYAHKAIQLGGYDYILQPARFEEVERVLQKACAKIFQDRKRMELEENRDFLKDQQEILHNSFLERLLVSEESEVRSVLEKLLKLLDKRYPKEVFYLVQAEILHWKSHEGEWSTRLVRMVVKNIMEETFEGLECQLFLCPIKNSGLFLLLYGNQASMNDSKVVEKIRTVHEFVQKNMDFAMAFYLVKAEKETIYKGLKRLEEMKTDNVMGKADTFVSEEQKKSGDSLKLPGMEQWFHYIERGEGELVRGEIEEYCRRADRRGELDLKRMKAIHFNFSKAFFAVAESRKIETHGIFTEAYPYEVFMEAYHTFDGLMKAVDYCLEFIRRQENTKEDGIQIALQYIHDNINQNISRKEVANLLYLNEEYFSRMFKAKVGLTFKDYVIQERMELAKKLLSSTNFSVGIIASKVGYDNFSYFSKIFKEMEHMTPLDYRQIHKRNS